MGEAIQRNRNELCEGGDQRRDAAATLKKREPAGALTPAGW